MTALRFMQQFPIGARVRMTQRAISAGLAWDGTTGVVVAYTTRNSTICILRDGRRVHAIYRVEFWEIDPTTAATQEATP